MHPRRVVITGMGAVTPLGHSVERFYQAACAGRSGVAPIRHFDARTFPTSFAAEVKDFELGRFVSGAERWANSGVNSQFAAAAAQQALADAGVLEDGRVDRTRFGIYLGSGEGIQDFPNLISLIARCWQREGRKFDAATFARGALQCFHRIVATLKRLAND